MVYDIYLFKAVDDPSTVRRVFEEHGLQPNNDEGIRGYMGLNLDFLQVTKTLFLLREQGATGIEVPIKYRDVTTKISKEQASVIAEPNLRESSSRRYPKYEFGLPIFASEQPMWYIFTINSEQLMRETKFPWNFYTYVDVLDGHIWTKEEKEQFFEPFETRWTQLQSGQDEP